MMMMNCFCGVVDWRKAFSLIDDDDDNDDDDDDDDDELFLRYGWLTKGI